MRKRINKADSPRVKIERPRFSRDKGGRIADKYKPEIINKICDYVKLGVPFQYAAIRAGVSHETFYRWRASYVEFAERIEDARAEFVVVNVARIEKAAKERWLAAAWMLERRCREDFGKQAIELSGINGQPIELGGSIEHHGALAQRLRADDQAIDAHTALLVRLGVRSDVASGIRLDDDDGGKRTVAPNALPRGDKSGVAKNSRRKNKATHSGNGPAAREK